MITFICMGFILVGTTLLLFICCALREKRLLDKYYNIKEEPHPELKTLRILYHQPVVLTTTIPEEKNIHKAVSIKYRALKTSVTNLEATMTTYQLYNANNVLWAKNLTLNQIENVISITESEELLNKEEYEN